jgi:hypothetical protein
MLSDLDKKVGDAVRHVKVVWQDAFESLVEARTKEMSLVESTEQDTGSAAELEDDDDTLPDSVSGVFSQVIQTLRSVTNIMPLATKTLIFARKEVSKLAKNLDSIFITFEDHGPPIFDTISGLWSTVWSIYFVIMLFFPLLLLFYAFWAGGFFGGPGGRIEDEDTVEGEKTVLSRVQNCCSVCGSCMCGPSCQVHDMTMCFWAVCILLQIVVLVLFLLSLVFCLLAAIKIFIASGCAQIYILGDKAVCGNTLLNLRTFLQSFFEGFHIDDLPDQCSHKQLLTCDMMANKMKWSGIWTVSGSMVVAVVSFQMIIESATLHTRAVERRRIQRQIKEGI